MKQLIYFGPHDLQWEEAREPTLESPTDALVRPIAVARCDLDALLARQSLGRNLRIGNHLGLVDPTMVKAMREEALSGPFPFGHEAVVEVMETGADVKEHAVGDRVVVSFQVSCGTCPQCGRGLSGHCETYRSFDMYSGIGRTTHRGGMLSDLVRVPHADYMLTALDESLDPVDLASASDNLPDAWSRIAPVLADRPGRDVVVWASTATQSIGLYAVAFAAAFDPASVTYVDRNPERCDIARRFGATVRRDGIDRIDDESADLFVNGTARQDALRHATRILRPGGVCATTNIYVRRSTPIPMFPVYAKSLTFLSGLANAAADIPAMLRFIVKKRIQVGAVTTLRAAWAEAPNALVEPTTKVVIVRN